MTEMTEHGQQYLDDLFVVSWLGMTPDRIDSHVYVLRGPDGLLLVDTGISGKTSLASLESSLAKLRLDFSSITVMGHYLCPRSGRFFSP